MVVEIKEVSFFYELIYINHGYKIIYKIKKEKFSVRKAMRP